MINIETAVANDQLPTMADYATQIQALSSLKSWSRFDPTMTTYGTSPHLAACIEQAPLATGSFQQATSGAQPTLVANSIAGYSAATFDGSAQYMSWSNSGSYIDFTAAYTVFALVSVDATAGALPGIMGRFSTVPTATWLASQVGNIAFNSGGTLITLPYTRGTWAFIVATGNGAGSITLRVNGVQSATFGITSAVETSGWAIGAMNAGGANLFKGQIAEIGFLTENVLATPARLALLENFAAYTFGLPFTPAAG